MPVATKVTGLSDERRNELLATLGRLEETGGIELKMSVPGEQRMALRGIGLDALNGRIREVVFFDTPDLALYRAGVVVRGRRTQQADDDTVVKLRPSPEDLPPAVRDSPNLKTELDVTRESFVLSTSLKGTRPPGTVTEVLSGQRTVEKLLTKEQRPFLADHLPQGVELSSLVPLGPIYVIRLKEIPPGFPFKLTVEVWHFPGEMPLIELSTKATTANVFRVVNDTRAFLKSHGLQATGQQEPKTRKALEFFAGLTTDGA